MQQVSFLKKTFFSLIAAGSLFLGTSCNKNDSNNDNKATTYSVSGNASGSQQVPAVTTSATGTLTGSYNKNTNTLNYTINWSGLSSTVVGVNFYGPAMTGVNANSVIIVTVNDTGVTASASGTAVVDDAVENALLDGNVYYSIRTVNNPNGEIRGQVSLTAN